MAQNMTLQGFDLERSKSLAKKNGTTRFPEHENTELDSKIIIIHLCALVQKLLAKTYFCNMVSEVMNSHIYISCTNH